MKKLLSTLFCLSIFAFGETTAQQTVGLFQNSPESQNGYTLFTRNFNTYLLDNCGFLVHAWQSDFTSSTSVYLLENGNLLRTCRIPTNNFNGGGIAGRIELSSWEGDLLWAYDYASETYHHHHDIEPLPNGNILILAWEKKTEQEALGMGRVPVSVGGGGLWPERIVEVEMVGTSGIDVVWEWHLWDHLTQDFDDSKNNFVLDISAHPELLDINAVTTDFTGPGGMEDWVHANAIAYHPGLDQIAVSSRHLSEVWVIDHSTTTAEAASHTGGDSGQGGDLLYRFGNPENYGRGTGADRALYGQHNVTWLPEGHPHEGKMMVFNNGANRFPNGDDYSSIDIWQPPMDAEGNYFIADGEPFGPTSLDWTFAEEGFFSPNISGAHGLPNGNVFVCDGRAGRFIDVTEDGETVWEYIVPFSGNNPVSQGQAPGNNSTFRATRYPAEYPAFEGRNLTPGLPLELNPWDSDCEIFGDSIMSSVRPDLALQKVRLRQNPVSDFIHLENWGEQPLRLEIYDAVGHPVFRTLFFGKNIEIETVGWPAGMYVLRVWDVDGRSGFTEKILKI